MNELTERKMRDGSKLYLRKAYDSVNREMLCQVLKKLRLSEVIIKKYLYRLATYKSKMQAE